jgi:AcrR family transcriptional regulator
VVVSNYGYQTDREYANVSYLADPVTEEPTRQRRRGSQLEADIREAVLAELAEAGYQGLSMQGVARRAGTGKAPLYRRWPGKDQMLIDVLAHQPPGRDESPADTGQLRGDLIQILAQMAAAMAQPTGRALYALIVEMALHRDRHPRAAEAIIETLLEPRLDAVTAALRRAAKRGEIRPAVITGLLAQTGPALVIHQQMHYGSPPSETEITEIVDRVLLPALNAPTAGR